MLSCTQSRQLHRWLLPLLVLAGLLGAVVPASPALANDSVYQQLFVTLANDLGWPEPVVQSPSPYESGAPETSSGFRDANVGGRIVRTAAVFYSEPGSPCVSEYPAIGFAMVAIGQPQDARTDTELLQAWGAELHASFEEEFSPWSPTTVQGVPAFSAQSRGSYESGVSWDVHNLMWVQNGHLVYVLSGYDQCSAEYPDIDSLAADVFRLVGELPGTGAQVVAPPPALEADVSCTWSLNPAGPLLLRISLTDPSGAAIPNLRVYAEGQGTGGGNPAQVLFGLHAGAGGFIAGHSTDYEYTDESGTLVLPIAVDYSGLTGGISADRPLTLEFRFHVALDDKYGDFDRNATVSQTLGTCGIALPFVAYIWEGTAYRLPSDLEPGPYLVEGIPEGPGAALPSGLAGLSLAERKALLEPFRVAKGDLLALGDRLAVTEGTVDIVWINGARGLMKIATGLLTPYRIIYIGAPRDIMPPAREDGAGLSAFVVRKAGQGALKLGGRYLLVNSLKVVGGPEYLAMSVAMEVGLFALDREFEPPTPAGVTWVSLRSALSITEVEDGLFVFVAEGQPVLTPPTGAPVTLAAGQGGMLGSDGSFARQAPGALHEEAWWPADVLTQPLGEIASPALEVEPLAEARLVAASHAAASAPAAPEPSATTAAPFAAFPGAASMAMAASALLGGLGVLAAAGSLVGRGSRALLIFGVTAALLSLCGCAAIALLARWSL